MSSDVDWCRLMPVCPAQRQFPSPARVIGCCLIPASFVQFADKLLTIADKRQPSRTAWPTGPGGRSRCEQRVHERGHLVERCLILLGHAADETGSLEEHFPRSLAQLAERPDCFSDRA
jgi:hypothetical protein